MKTLDEVIEELNIWDAYDHEYPDVFYDVQTIRDALHYLNHLKDYYEISANGGLLTPEPRSAEIGSGVEIKWHEPNPALTWQELRTMEGKPVWVEGSAFAYGFWAIPYCFENSGGNEYVFMWGDQYWREEMRDADDGISWQAYRKERE